MGNAEPRTQILVVDDSAPIRLLLCRVVEKKGYEAIPAVDGTEAVALCREQLPDLILMDMVMPGLDGFEATRQIRQLAGDTWIPILLVSSLDDDKEKVKVLEAGGDDFLSKPVNTFILEAKITSFLRISRMQGELSRYRARSENERQLAAHLVNHIVPKRVDLPGTLRWELPAERVSGDIMLSTLSPTGVQVSMLADSTGHGLAAAICLQPAVSIFLSMAEKGFSVSSIVSEMNRRLYQMLPTGQFLAATLVSVDPSQDLIQIWNGGMPAVWMLNAQGEKVAQIEAHSPPLGIYSEQEFDAATKVFPCTDPVWVLLCSDGLLEAENADGESYGEERLLLDFQGKSPEAGFFQAKAALIDHIGGSDGLSHDDISLALIRAPLMEAPALPTLGRSSAEDAGWSDDLTWDFTVRLGAAQLRQIEIQPLVSCWLAPLRLPVDQTREVLIIITELFNNALDHGILGLDSGLKKSVASFIQFYALRAERLAALSAGNITMTLGRRLEAGRPMLHLLFEDSGAGFNFRQSPESEHHASPVHGRGLALVRSLCASVNFEGNGNRVTACYCL